MGADDTSSIAKVGEDRIRALRKAFEEIMQQSKEVGVNVIGSLEEIMQQSEEVGVNVIGSLEEIKQQSEEGRIRALHKNFEKIRALHKALEEGMQQDLEIRGEINRRSFVVPILFWPSPESGVGETEKREESSAQERISPLNDQEVPRRLAFVSSDEKASHLYTSLLFDYADAYARLGEKYTQLLAAFTSAQLSASSGSLGVSAYVSLSSEKAMEGEEPNSPVEPLRLPVGASTTVRIEIDEDPLTVERIGTLFSTFTTLTTKYWLISQGRLADLIEFSKSHDERFIREAQAVITRISYNSPLNFDIKLSATDTAQAVTTTIDGIVQTGQRFRQMELATKTKEQEFQQAEQRFAEEIQRTQKQEAFEQEKRQLELARQQIELERLRLEVEKQRLELVALRLDAQRKSLDHAFEIAHKVIGQLHPQADDATKRMLVQTYVGEILQLSGIAFTSVTIVEVDTAPSAQKEKEE